VELTIWEEGCAGVFKPLGDQIFHAGAKSWGAHIGGPNHGGPNPPWGPHPLYHPRTILIPISILWRSLGGPGPSWLLINFARDFSNLFDCSQIEKLDAVITVAKLLALSPMVDEFKFNLKFLRGGGAVLGALENQIKLRFPGIVCRQSEE